MNFARNTLDAKRSVIMKWRWLVVVGVSVLLSACANVSPHSIVFPPCGPPGGVNKKEAERTAQENVKEAERSCYYFLTITATEPEVRGHVAKSVVLADIDQLRSRDKYTIDDYQFIEFLIPLSDPNDKGKLALYKDYWFVSIPGSPRLKLTADEDLPPHENDVPKSALPTSKVKISQ